MKNDLNIKDKKITNKTDKEIICEFHGKIILQPGSSFYVITDNEEEILATRIILKAKSIGPTECQNGITSLHEISVDNSQWEFKD